MNDREKLVELLEGCEEICTTCGSTYSEAADFLIARGVTVKQTQKPLTVEELYDRQGAIVYLEYAKNKLEEYPFVLTFLGHYFAEFDSYGGKSVGLTIADNGYTWRCWAKRPTEEERQAAEWEK